MSDLTFMLCAIVLCAVVLGAPATVYVLYNNLDPAYIGLGFFGGGVLGLAISTGAIGFGNIHESIEAEKEEYAQQRINEERKKWEENKQ